MKLDLQFFAKDKSDSYNDRIDSAKQAYNEAYAKGDTAGMEKAHQQAEAVRAEATKAGYTAGNYVSTSSNSSRGNGDMSNYSSAYDVATNFTRPTAQQEPEEERPFASGDYNTVAQQLADAKKKAQLEQLNKSYNNVIAQIAKSEEQTKANAKTNRDNASVQNQLADARTASQLAQLGLTNSGTNAQMKINSAGALQNNIGKITSNEQNALNEYLNQRNLAKSNLESDINSAYANIDATQLQNQLNYIAQMEQMQRQQDNQIALAQLQRDWNNSDKVEYTDPYTGQTLMLTPSEVAQLNMQNYVNKTKLSSGGGSTTPTTSLGYLEALQKAKNEYLGYLQNGVIPADMTEQQYVQLYHPELVEAGYNTTPQLSEEDINNMYKDNNGTNVKSTLNTIGQTAKNISNTSGNILNATSNYLSAIGSYANPVSAGVNLISNVGTNAIKNLLKNNK